MAYGSTIGDILYMWADFGVFAYLLPFLMIFAIVYGILSKSGLLGKNKGVDATIALAVGLLALQSGYVTNFYAMIFPYTGMAIAVLLVALILMGLTGTELPWTKYVWFGIGLISFIFVLIYSFGDFTWFSMGGGYGFSNAMPAIIAFGLLLAVMAFIIFSKDSS
ncbi:hypothetical protein HOE04_05445 [archaeon]|jgi:hypothetical protein|nr:hypothetical protein [archaeon]